MQNTFNIFLAIFTNYFCHDFPGLNIFFVVNPLVLPEHIPKLI